MKPTCERKPAASCLSLRRQRITITAVAVHLSAGKDRVNRHTCYLADISHLRADHLYLVHNRIEIIIHERRMQTYPLGIFGQFRFVSEYIHFNAVTGEYPASIRLHHPECYHAKDT